MLRGAIMTGRDGRVMLTQKQAAKALGCSVRRVRSLRESGQLASRQGPDRTWWVDQCDVERVAAQVRRGSVKRDASGEVSALIFSLFERGMSPAKVVIEARQNPEVIKLLAKDYRELEGGVWIPPAVRHAVEQLLEERGYVLADWSGELVDAIRALCATDRRYTELQRRAAMAQTDKGHKMEPAPS